MKVIHDENREKDLQRVCEAVLDISPICYDNPNGAYETMCPFCYVEEHREGNHNNIFASMIELNHKPDCIYLIAKDLTIETITKAL